jgi:hypothetical protein
MATRPLASPPTQATSALADWLCSLRACQCWPEDVLGAPEPSTIETEARATTRAKAKDQGDGQASKNVPSVSPSCVTAVAALFPTAVPLGGTELPLRTLQWIFSGSLVVTPIHVGALVKV